MKKVGKENIKVGVMQDDVLCTRSTIFRLL
jgi:hypothetical protein